MISDEKTRDVSREDAGQGARERLVSTIDPSHLDRKNDNAYDTRPLQDILKDVDSLNILT